jgi:hypothetical protein
MHVPDFSTSAKLLAPGEVAATSARQLTAPQRAALIACAFAGCLQRFRSAWKATDDHPFISASTVEHLRERGLLIVSNRKARLSDNGKWYTRTLCSDISRNGLTAEGVGLCPIEN